MANKKIDKILDLLEQQQFILETHKARDGLLLSSLLWLSVPSHYTQQD